MDKNRFQPIAIMRERENKQVTDDEIRLAIKMLARFAMDRVTDHGVVAFEEDITRLGYQILRLVNNDFKVDDYVLSGGKEGYKYVGVIHLNYFIVDWIDRHEGKI